VGMCRPQYYSLLKTRFIFQTILAQVHVKKSQKLTLAIRSFRTEEAFDWVKLVLCSTPAFWINGNPTNLICFPVWINGYYLKKKKKKKTLSILIKCYLIYMRAGQRCGEVPCHQLVVLEQDKEESNQ